MKKLLIIVIVIALCTILPYSISPLRDSIFAAESHHQLLKLSPFIFMVQLSPNKTYQYEMSIENLQKIPMPIRISTEDFMIENDKGSYAFGENTENSLVSWITIAEAEQILEPLEKTTIHFTVKTPSLINFGGYHGMIFVEPILPQNSQYTSFLATKIGAPVIASIGAPTSQNNPIRILKAEWPYLVTSLNSLTFDIALQNNSLFHTSAKPIITFKPLFGPSSKQFLDEKLIFPGKTRSWGDTLPTATTLSPNMYQSTLMISAGNGSTISRNHTFLYIPMGILLVAVGLILLIVLSYLHFTKKIHIRAFLSALLNHKVNS